ncbi:MAG: sialidase family protein [Anaerolineae bacterium]|nr:sialidase family protein [Anaerolineae bacterium]
MVEPLKAGDRPKADERMINLMWPIKNVLSGPGWLMAQGIDPRAWLERPGWDPLTRLDWEKLDYPLASREPGPAQQAGPGILVPYRSPAPAFSRDLLVTRDFGDLPLQTEPHLAVNPRDPEHLLLGVIDYNLPSISAYVSIDGGVTWEGPRQIRYQRGDRVSGGDPVVAFDRQGNAYFASISIGTKEFSIGPLVGFAMVSSIQVATSPDGGFTWNEPVSTARSEVTTTDITTDAEGRIRGKVHMSFLDKPWMTIGPHPTEKDKDVIYVTYTDFVLKYEILYVGEVPTLGVPEMETTIRLVRSEDGGVTWSDPVAVSPTVRRVYGEVTGPGEAAPVAGTKRLVQGSQVAVGPDGTVYVAWLDSTDDESMKGLAELYLARSEDGGKSFEEPQRITIILEPGFRPRNAYFRYWAAAFPQLATGPKGEVYVVYTALPPDKPTDEGDIYFVRSQDGGKNWRRPVRLNQDDTDRLQFFPAIDVGPDGVIHVMWGDMRDDAVETRYHIYYTQSKDGGQTWGFEAPELNLKVGDTRVTDYPSNPNKGFPYGLFIGDYFSLAATKDDVYLVWADARLGEFGPTNQKIGFSRRQQIPAPEVFMSPAAGPGGQSITVQGHNFQPDMNVYLQMGDTTVATARTNAEGRVTAEVFVPISGEGAHPVRLVDESGNVASGTFYMEFGFDNVREVLDAQRETQRRLEGLDQKLGALAPGAAPAVPPETLQNLEQNLQRLQAMEEEIRQLRELVEQEAKEEPAPTGAGLPPWSLALVGLLGLAIGAAAYAWVSQRGKG